MKLYWSPRSPFVRKVMVCAHEIGVANQVEKIYTLVSASAVNDEMLRTNPLGRIPALVTDSGDVLYDSVVICEYLDALHGGRRLFLPGKGRWDALRRHALANGMLELLVLWRGELTRPASQRSPETLRAFEHKTRSALSAADRDSAALQSTEVDIGHVTLGVALGYLDFRYAEIDWRSLHRNLALWYGSFGARPSMRETAPQDEQAGGGGPQRK